MPRKRHVKLSLGGVEHLASPRLKGYNSRVTLEVLGMTTDIYDKARDLGALNAQSRALLPTLALAALEAAERGEIDGDDASDIYAIYSKATEPEEAPTVNSMKANASKLRQIILCGAERKGARHVFQRMVAMHAEHYKRDPQVLPLYKAMLQLARWMKDRDDEPSDRVLARLLKGNG